MGWGLLRLALLAATCAVAFGKQQLRKQQGPIDGIGKGTPCPRDPLELCDFYFKDREDETPTFDLPRAQAGDVPISPPIVDSKSRGHPALEVDSSGTPLFLCPAPDGTRDDGSNPHLGITLYAQGDAGRIHARNLQNVDKGELEGRCVLMPLTSVRLASNLNLNWGDSNQARYPDERRCVVFTIENDDAFDAECDNKPRKPPKSPKSPPYYSPPYRRPRRPRRPVYASPPPPYYRPRSPRRPRRPRSPSPSPPKPRRPGYNRPMPSPSPARPGYGRPQPSPGRSPGYNRSPPSGEPDPYEDDGESDFEWADRR